jgi:tetratricopeptide (TPR) repeat protein
MTAFVLVYLWLLGGRALLLLQTAEPVAQLMGLLMLGFPLLAVWAVFVELRFGLKAAALAEKAAALGVEELDIERRPSGRAVRESAQQAFDRISAEVELDETNWALWFRLGEAYDACGDRKRARQAIRKAISLSA